MLRIGDFSRLGQVSVVTLRHYDELGLLKPVHVDAATGYRYYSAAQLPRLHRILALKDLGFSLEQIERALSAGLAPAALRELLQAQRAEVARRVAEDQARLARLEARLRQIEHEAQPPTLEVVVKRVPAMRVAARRLTLPTNDQAPTLLPPAIGSVYAFVRASAARPSGPCLAVWHQPAHVHANEEVEVMVPLDRHVPGGELVQVRELEAATVAAVARPGPFVSLADEHSAVLRWIDANGYTIVGPYREVYIWPEAQDMDNAATEVQYPVEKPA